jgi:NAD(P)-dependent dehydrogenase (short-subunit alcohol dehydrogenase family)
MPNPSPALQPLMDTQPLQGQVILITGAAGGLGRCIAALACGAGASVVMVDIASAKLQQAADELSASGANALPLVLDVGAAAQATAALAAAHDHFGRLDAVINNAAIDVTAPIAELDPAEWDHIVRTNLSGPFFMARAAAAAMADSGGHIVNVCSTASKRAWPNAAAYHATKWGLLGLSHALHAELRSQRIKVCALIAGGMRTPFLLDRFPDIDPDLLQDPMDVARAVLFVLLQPPGTVIPELTVLPMKETSWP